MKKIIKLLALLAAAAAALVSCQKEIEKPNQEPEAGKFVYTFTLGEPETKAVLASDSEGYFAQWEAGDQLGIYTLNNNASETTNNTAADIDISKNPVEFKVVTSYALDERSEVYAYFPYDANNSTAAAEDPSKVVLSIPASQTGSLNAMPMAAKPYAVTEPISVGTKPIADIKMRNLGSILNFNVFSSVEAYRSETVSSIAFTTETPLCGSFTYDIMEAELADITGYKGTTVTVAKNITPGNDRSSGNTVPMVVAPNAEAGYTGTLLVTTDVAAYTYTISNPLKVARSEIRRVNVDLGSANAVRVEMKTVQFSVNGVIVDGMTQKLLPGAAVEFDDPEASLVPDGMDFMGWYNYGYNNQDTAPEYITEAVVENTDLVYYAVFATKTPGSAASVVFDLQSIDKLSTSNAERTQTAGDITFTFSSVADANVSGTHYVQMAKNSTLTHDTAFAGPIKSITFEGFGYSSTSNASMLVEGKAGVGGTYSTVQSCDGSYNGAEISFGSNDYDFFKITVGSERTVRFTKMTVSYGTEEYYSGFCTSVNQVKAIEVATVPNKVEYEEDDELDITGLTLKVTYEDESSEVINTGFTTTPSNGAVLAQENKVQVSYRGQTCEVDITVNQKQRYDIVASATEGGSYTVKIGDADIETVPAEGKTYHARAERTITMTTKAAEHYKLASTPFTVKDADNADVSVSKDGDNYSFTMPAKAVTIKANYSRTYTITAGACTNGSITKIADKDDKEITETSKGSKVVVTATPDEHYHVASMYYVKEGEESHNVILESAGVYSFTMPQSDVTVYATFEEDTKYTATFMVNGTKVRSDDYYEGQSISFPDDPSDINGKKFQGWSTSTIAGITDKKPTLVNKATETMGSTDATYYAVFATGTEVTSETITFTPSATIITGSYNSTDDFIWNNITFGRTNVNYQNDGAQIANIANSALWNKEPIPGPITKLEIRIDKNSCNFTAGSVVNPTTNSTSLSVGNNTKNYSADNDVRYFKIARVDAYTVVKSISVTYQAGGWSEYCTTVELPKVLQSIYFADGCDVENKDYSAGQALNPTGLIVMGHYDKGEDEDITSLVSWTYDPATLSAGTTSCRVIASYGGEEASTTVTGLTVTDKTDLDAPSGITWTESSKTLSWTDLNTSKGTYGTNYKYQYSVNGGSSWLDATSSTTAVLSITSTTTVKVKAVAITTVTHNSSSEVEKSCTITPVAKTTATLTLSSSKKFGTSSGSTLNDDKGNTWTCTGTGIQNSYQTSYSGQQFGTGSTANTYTFTCTPPDGKTVTSVKIKAACGNSNGNYKIEVGSNVWKDFSALSTTSKEYTATGSATGQIKITLQQPQSGTKKAVYLGMIEIIYQ